MGSLLPASFVETKRRPKGWLDLFTNVSKNDKEKVFYLR